MKLKKILALVLALMMVCSLFAACGDDSGSSSEGGSSTTSEGGEADTGTTGGELDLRSTMEPTSLNTLLATYAYDFTPISAMVECLYRIAPDDSYQPAAAETVDISEDQKVYTFHLREDAKWSNGDPVIATDFEFAWKQALSPEVASNYAYMLFFIHNAEAYLAGKVEWSEVGVKVIDEYTLEVTLDNPLPYGEGEAPGRKLLIAGAAVCLMSVVISLDDTIAVFLDAEGSVDLTGVVRLSYAGAVMLFGLLADLRKRAYLPFITACVLVGSTLMFVFLDSPDTYSVNAVLLYILSASSVVYLTVAFLDLASRTAHPELWAGMGRVLRSFSVAATAVPFIRLYGAVGHAAMMAVAFVASVAVLALFFADGQLSPGRAERQARARGIDGLAGFAEKYGLTPRETDVLAAALYNDKAPKEIAYDLQISERIVQRYFNSIYEKTGTQGRVGLTLLYTGYTPEAPSGTK